MCDVGSLKLFQGIGGRPGGKGGGGDNKVEY